MTLKEIEKLTAYLVEVFKDIFATKEDIAEIKESIQIMQSALDAGMKKATVEEQEIIIMNYRMKNAENWIDRAAPKIGIGFEH